MAGDSSSPTSGNSDGRPAASCKDRLRVLGDLPNRDTRRHTRAIATTTIKVPTELRDRISASARSRATTAAGLLTGLLDEHERAERFAAVKAVYARLSPDDDYWAETPAWEALDAPWTSDHG
jgi:hypothetical protein